MHQTNNKFSKNHIQSFLTRSKTLCVEELLFQPKVLGSNVTVDQTEKSRFVKKKLCCCIVPVIKKTFDAIDHEQLLTELEQNSIKSFEIDWLRLHFWNRYHHRVNLENAVFCWAAILCGG